MSKKNTNSNIAPPVSLNDMQSKTFKYKDFQLKIFQGEETLICHVTENEDLSATLYKVELSLEELLNLNIIFRLYKSIKEVFTLFFSKLDESKLTFKKEENKINLSILVEIMGQKDEMIIQLMPEQPNIDNIVMKLCEKVKEIDSLKNIVNEQKKIIEKQQKEFNDYKNSTEKTIKELEALIKKESEGLKYNIKYNNGEYINSDEIINYKEALAKFTKMIDTNIMKYNELNLIETGVQKNLNKKIKKYTLIFKASRDGFRAQDFHYKCDGKNNTLTLVETIAGKRFGGFTDAQQDQSGNYKSGSNGFIFSLDDKVIYYSQNSSYNIYCDSGCGPYFGSGDFYLCDNCNTSNSSSDNSNNSYNTNSKKFAMAGTYNFLVKDYEVYQLELE